MKILFVCLGNICRSPAAEGVFLTLAEKQGLSSQFQVDSAGILSFHQGKPADARMRAHAEKRGYQLLSHSRPVEASKDFDTFDLVIAMDKRNYADLNELAGEQKAYQQKIVLMSEFFTESKLVEVPDPYYGGPEGFEQVLDLVEEGSREILRRYGHGRAD